MIMTFEKSITCASLLSYGLEVSANMKPLQVWLWNISFKPIYI
ncbi:hypothetical protein [Helicobacter saguini]|nr:hypothetical protein [Helicobacter saguini]